MKMRKDIARGPKPFWRCFASRVALPVVMLAFAACGRPAADSDANHAGAQDPNHPELFSIRPEQMAHVQVVTVSPPP